MKPLVDQLRRVKMLLVSLVLTLLGVAFLIIEELFEFGGNAAWVGRLPWSELGGILFGAGLLSVWLDRAFRDQEELSRKLQLENILREHAPELRDAVLSAFADGSDKLERVATPETLDHIITNSLGLRLKDHDFAADVYSSLRSLYVEPPERWHDVELDVQLAPAPDRPQHFEVLVRWSFTAQLKSGPRTFKVVSDKSAYVNPSTQSVDSIWFFAPDDDLNASSKEAFQLLRFGVDGEELPIKRLRGRGSQEYVIDVPRRQTPSRVSYSFRTVTDREANLLFFELERPSDGLSVAIDHSGVHLDRTSLVDMLAGSGRSLVELQQLDGRDVVLRIDRSGWLAPRSGVVFVWHSGS